MWQEGEALYLLVVGQLLLQGVDALLHHLDDLGVSTELLASFESDAVFTGVFLEERIDGDDEGGDELALVGDDGNLVDELVNEQLRLNHLWCDVFTVGGLEQVLDALFQEELTILQVTGITGLEVAVLRKGCLGEVLAVVVATGYRRTLQQYLVVLTNLDVNALNGNAYAAHRPGLAQMVTAHRGQRLGKAIADNHIDSDGMDEFLDML